VSVDRLEQLFQLGFAPDEPAQLRSQVAGCRRPGRRPQRRRFCRIGQGERGVLGQDSGLQFSQGATGFDPQLVD
jgi:hypothetical protein